MIEVSHLTKRYGTHTAIADLSFHIEKGQIYGLLGPNGAGKSTTMNIMTGCLSASSGSVTVGGHDIFEEAGPAKRLLGYLPERPPSTWIGPLGIPLLRRSGQRGGQGGFGRADPPRHGGHPDCGCVPAAHQEPLQGVPAAGGHRPGPLGDPEVVILGRTHRGPGSQADHRDPLPHPGPGARPYRHPLQPHSLGGAGGVPDHPHPVPWKTGGLRHPCGPGKRFAGGAAVELVAEAGAEEVCHILTPLGPHPQPGRPPPGRTGPAPSPWKPTSPRRTCAGLCSSPSAAPSAPLLHMAATRASLEDIFLNSPPTTPPSPPMGRPAQRPERRMPHESRLSP